MGVAGGVIMSFIALGSPMLYLTIGLIVCGVALTLYLNMGLRSLSVIVVIIVLAVGFFRTEYAEYCIHQTKERLTPGQHELLAGVVDGEPAIIGAHQRFVLRTHDDVRIRVTTDRYPAVSFGDHILLTGSIQLPDVFETDTGRTFNYPTFLHARGVTHVSLFPEITVLGTHERSLRRVLFASKQWFLDRIGRALPEPHASLVGGVTVGAQDALGEELLDDFRGTGLIHIVVLSGFNIAIVVLALRWLLAWAPRYVAFGAASVGIILFALLVGGGATVIRASIMGLLGLMSIMLPGRHGDIVRGLMFAGLVMIVWNPYVLLFDPSFQLSFLATLGLIYLAPFFIDRLAWVPMRWGLREIVAATIATQVFVLPLLVYMNGVVSSTSVLSNVLVLPVIPFIMLFGSIAGVVGSIGLPIAYVASILVSYVLGVVDLLARVPTVTLPAFPVWIVIVVYSVYAFQILRVEKEKARNAKRSAPPQTITRIS